MNAMLVIKLIDLTVMGLTAWMEWERAEAASNPHVQDLLSVRNQVADGDISPEDGMLMVAQIVDDIQEPLDAEIEELKRLIP